MQHKMINNRIQCVRSGHMKKQKGFKFLLCSNTDTVVAFCAKKEGTFAKVASEKDYKSAAFRSFFRPA